MSTSVTNNRSRLLAALLAAALLVTGAAIGISVDRLWLRGAASHQRHGWKHHDPEHVMRWFRSKLSLSDDQATQIEAIIRDTRNSAHAAKQRIHPQLKALHEHAQKQILELLDAEQAAKYKKLIEHRKRHFRHMHKARH